MNKCPKCGAPGVVTQFERSGEERLRKTCGNCRYEWFTKTLDQELEGEEPLLK